MASKRRSRTHAPASHRPSHQRARPSRRRARRRGPSPMVVMGIVVFGLAVAATLLTLGGGEDGGRETGAVTLGGASLPKQGGTPDPAAGMAAPVARGVNFDGTAVAIENDGKPKAIVFLAHWCPHCEKEVPKVVSWLEQTGGVEGVDVVAVSTWADRTRANWPPSAWLERERWTSPVLLDDGEGSVAKAYGLSGTPMWVFVGKDGKVVKRTSGEVPVDTLESEMRALVA